MPSILAHVICALTIAAADPTWQKLSPLPDTKGVAGSFAGVSGDYLLVAGGANFPDKKPWEGGKKRWYDTVYALDMPDGKWIVAGKLPRPLGYGVSVSWRDAVICAGGSDAERHHADVFRLEFKSGKLMTEQMPPLPIAVANTCGALLGDTLYLAGGQEKLDSKSTLKRMFAMDLTAKEPKWRELEAWPGSGRILAVAAAFDGNFWLMGGADLVVDGERVERRWLRDAYRYNPKNGWKRIADLPRPVVAAPSPTVCSATGPLIFGGDDGSQVNAQPDKHLGFSKRILRYDSKADKWIDQGEMPAPRVTTPLVSWKDLWVIPSGEVRPGVRSPEVWALPAK